MSVEEVMDHHNDAFGNCDLEEVMKDYDDESVIMTPDGNFEGTDEIRPMFEGFFDEFDDPETTMDVSQFTIEDNVAYLVWEAETPDNVYEMGTDTFVIEDDIIKKQTYAAEVTPK